MRFLPATLAVILLATVPAVWGEEEVPPSAVELHMDQMSRDLKKLSRRLDAPGQKDACLALVDSALAANAACQKLVPASAGERSGKELEDYLALYQQGLAELEASLQKLRRALADGNMAGAAEELDAAYDLRKRYHQKLL
jgi:soluble cytochrome b562